MNYSRPPSQMTKIESKTSRKISPRLLLLGVVALGAIGYGVYSIETGTADYQPGAGRAGGEGGGAPVPVRVGKVSTQDIPIRGQTIGTVIANAVVSLKSQVDGQLLSAKFKEGDLVKQGDVLFQIDPRPLEAALRQAEAQIARDQAQLASAQSDADRAATLAERGIVSMQQRDQMIAQAKALTATLAADQAALDRARLNFSYTTIRAPVSGKTGPYLVHPGNLVSANDDTLVVINQIQPVKISFFLPQKDLPALQDRMAEGALSASLRVHNEQTGPRVTTEGDISVKIDFIGNVVDEKTGTVELRATFNNPDRRLVPGELVDVTVQLDTIRNAIIVPLAAVNIGQTGGTYVFVVKPDQKVEMRPVRVQFQDEEIAAVGTELKPGETVVTDGQLRLTPDAPVSIVSTSGTQAAAPSEGQAKGENRAAK